MATSMIYRDRNMKEASEGKDRVHTQWQEKIIFLKLVKQSFSAPQTFFAVNPPVKPGAKCKSFPSISFSYLPKWSSVMQTSQTQCSKINHCKATTNVSLLKVVVHETIPVARGQPAQVNGTLTDCCDQLDFSSVQCYMAQVSDYKRSPVLYGQLYQVRNLKLIYFSEIL